MRVLVVEDEHKINRAVCQALREEAYAVDSAADGNEAEELALINEYDLIVIGSHGPPSRSAFASDDVTIQIVAGADRSVLVVPPGEY